MMAKNEYIAENSGENAGLIVGHNSGDIHVTLQQAVKIPSLISSVVRTLGDICSLYDIDENANDFHEYKPDEKIEYNSVVKYREIIKEFATYYSVCDRHLNIYDDSNIRGKAKILKCVHIWYLRAKGEILAENTKSNKTEMEIVRENADRIIDMVKTKIYEAITGAKELDNIYAEDIEVGIECFTCFCFMECKILEKPK